MSDLFLLRGRSALLRDIMAAWISLTVGSILFGIVFAKYYASGEGIAFVAASVLSIPVASLLLLGIRSKHLRIPNLSIPKGVPASDAEDASGWKSGPGHSRYISTKDRDAANRNVIDVTLRLNLFDRYEPILIGREQPIWLHRLTQRLNLADGYEAILIGHKQHVWLYLCQSNMYPPHGLKLFLNASEELCIEGGGQAILLKSRSLEEAMADEEAMAELVAPWTATAIRSS